MEVNYTAWGEFGLAGLVIGTLFTGGYFIIRWIFNFVNGMTKQHAEERDDWRTFAEQQTDLHRQERGEWREELKVLSADNKAGIDRVCDLITGSIAQIALRDLRNAQQAGGLNNEPSNEKEGEG